MGWIKFGSKVVCATYPKKEMDAEHTFHWRRNIYVFAVITFTLLCVHILITKGKFSEYGLSGVAFADDVQKQIEDSIGPIKKTVDLVDTRTKAILRATYSPQIRAKIRQRCDTDDAVERERINRDLDRLLKEYKDSAGSDFEPLPGCDEV